MLPPDPCVLQVRLGFSVRPTQHESAMNDHSVPQVAACATFAMCHNSRHLGRPRGKHSGLELGGGDG
jgi:hypothetical protein